MGIAAADFFLDNAQHEWERALTALDRNAEVSITPKPETQPHGRMKVRAVA